MSVQDLYGQAAALHQRGQLAEAERLYREVIKAAPKAFPPLHMLGILKAQQGKAAEAETLIAAALKLQPRDGGALANYGNVLTLLGRFEEALESYDRALSVAPDAETLRNRAQALQSLNRPGEALASYDAALQRDPKDAQSWFKRGVLLGEQGRPDEALASYDRVLALQPGHVEALNNRGYGWWLFKQRYVPAVADMQKALALAPDFPYARGGVLHLNMYAADWSRLEREKAAISQGIAAGALVARPFMLQALSDNPAELQACARIYVRDQYPPVMTLAHDRTARKGRDKIKIGYLSGEFREQATAILMAGLYERHDRDAFEIIAIDNDSADQSAMTARLKQAFDGWIDIGGLSGAQAAEKIRAAQIDILVNLNGYFGKHRMDVFAHRPAPLQVNYLGFPGTLGAPYIDYIIADRIVIPADEDVFYDEQVITLPGSYQVNDDRGRVIAPVPSRSEAGLPDDAFVFCNFNQSYKLTPETFASWMRILKQVDGSVLWLLEAASPFADNIAAHARAHGVAPERILFAPDRPPAQHLARLSLADLFLDGLPYNAHTTASDALWAGVPLVTRRGTAFPGRVAASLLTAAGLPELVTETAAAYEALAIRLATDKNALRALREKLATSRAGCALFDTDLFRRNIEAAYCQMWQRWLAGEKAEGFSI
jgi:predicted O-linked N-acetylglucosamine transferase (SPINDLY family)